MLDSIDKITVTDKSQYELHAQQLGRLGNEASKALRHPRGSEEEANALRSFVEVMLHISHLLINKLHIQFGKSLQIVIAEDTSHCLSTCIQVQQCSSRR